MNRWIIILLPLFLIIMVGCNEGSPNPVTPSPGMEQPSISMQSKPSTNTSLMGYYDIYYDIGTRTFEAVENRNVSFTLNIVPFLNKMYIPQNGITFGQIVIHDDDPSFLGIDVEFVVHHPFPGYDQYDAYDLRGVVIGNGAKTLTYDGMRVSEHGVDLWMKNPDGYTRWMNPTEFTTDLIFGYCPGGFQNLAGDANLNPYKYYAKHLAEDQNIWYFLTGDNHWDGIFESGCGRMMELEFPMPPDGLGLMFGYAVVVCWEEQGPDGPYYPVHVAEAVAASITQTDDVWYNHIDGSGGDLILDIDLFAWEYQPSTIKIESTVLDGIYEYDAAVLGEPVSDYVSTYHVEETAKLLSSNEGHEVWIIAEYDAFDFSNGLPDIPHADGPLTAFFREDVFVDTAPGNHKPTCDLTSDPEVDYGGEIPVTITFYANGFDDDGDDITYEWSENGTDWTPGTDEYVVEYTVAGFYSIYVVVTDIYGAYSECSIIDFEVAEGPTAVASACTCLWISPGESVTFSGAQSYTANSFIADYDWDFDGDGNFGDTHAGAPENPTVSFNTSGDYYVNLRVTDDLGYTDKLDADELLHVQVGSWTPPTANAHIVPTIGFVGSAFEGDFEGSGSTGTINLYEWDFEGDCVWDYIHDTIGDTTHAYEIPGMYDATLRVTGNGCDSVVTPVRMIEPIGILGNSNFWDGVTWTPWTHHHSGVAYATYLEELFPSDTYKTLAHFYRSGTSDGGTTHMRQLPGNYDVTGFDELYFNLFFNINYDNTPGDGWMGGEFPVCVRISYNDADSNFWQMYWGWDDEYDGHWQWDDPAWLPSYVTYHYQEQVNTDTWYERKTIDLMTVDPPPAEIVQVLIGSFGWTWDVYMALPWFSEE